MTFESVGWQGAPCSFHAPGLVNLLRVERICTVDNVLFWYGRSEGFPERDIWFLGTLDQGSARCPELLGRRRRHLETQVDIQARKLQLKVFLRFWGRGERSRRMETGVLHRISMRVS